MFKTIKSQNNLNYWCQSTGSESHPAVRLQMALHHTHTHAHSNVTRHSHLTGRCHRLYDWFILFSLLRNAHHIQSWGACTTLLWLPLDISWPSMNCSLAGGSGALSGMAGDWANRRASCTVCSKSLLLLFLTGFACSDNSLVVKTQREN